MKLHKIQKQKLLAEPFSNDALKLAKAIYNTYIEDDKNLYMEININIIIRLLRLQAGDEAVKYIRNLFEELNEPLLVKEFKFYGEIFPMKFINFCEYTITKSTIEIELNDKFLLAESEYMIDKFLT
ncbi:MAG: hypothetical protein DRG78_11880 [Epsilonproteobacteria bacterium]|nr:MAG: hypothetical protein DRG78_11880 [Campylobacterota bacterium]